MQVQDSDYISIIVPIYNSAKFLPMLIESVLAQTYPKFELLCIDDGSTDESAHICKSYAQKDTRIKYYKKNNGGVSSARNYGIEKALFNNIIFLDSDDYLAADYLAQMYNGNADFDFVISGYIKISDGNPQRSLLPKPLSATNPYEISKYFYLLDNGLLGPVWSKLFKKNIITTQDIRFENIESEDELFVFEYIKHIESFKRINYAGYYYRTVEGSRNGQHKNIAEWNWIKQILKNYKTIFNKFHIIPTKTYIVKLQNNFLNRYTLYILKGYFKDTRVPYKERIKRWHNVPDIILNSKFQIRNIVSRRTKILMLIYKFKLYYLIDSIIIAFLNLRRN